MQNNIAEGWEEKEKKETNNLNVRGINKLLLNSLYGKFGKKDFYFKVCLMETKKAIEITKNYSYTYLCELNNGLGLSVIKYGERIDERLRKIYKQG